MNNENDDVISFLENYDNPELTESVVNERSSENFEYLKCEIKDFNDIEQIKEQLKTILINEINKELKSLGTVAKAHIDSFFRETCKLEINLYQLPGTIKELEATADTISKIVDKKSKPFGMYVESKTTSISSPNIIYTLWLLENKKYADEPLVTCDINEPDDKDENVEINEKYQKLKTFLKNNGFELIYDIDYLYSCFEFAFSSKSISFSKFHSTQEVREYFISNGFAVEAVAFRNSTLNGLIQPVIKFKRLLKDGLEYYVVRVDYESSFFYGCEYFSDIFDDEPDMLSLEDFEEDNSENEPKKSKKQKNSSIVFNKSKLLLSVFAIFAVFVTCSFVVSKEERRPALEKELDRDNFVLPPDYFSTLTAPSHQDITFRTTDGFKEFYNAEYEMKFLKCIVKSYKSGCFNPYRTDIFPRSIIKSITLIDSDDDDSRED